VIFYVDSLVRGTALEFTFQMRAVYPVRAAGPVSEAYEYYDPDVRAHDRSPGVSVTPRETVPGQFLRGDANADGGLDLSDAIWTLGYLFVDAARHPLRCEDAADTNDDGDLDITDPIYLLQHLFQGGPAPAAPYPQAGVDGTADELRC
jgi:hypothetical protein